MQSEYNLPYTNSKIIEPAIDFIHLNYYKENGNFIFEKLNTNVGFKEGSGFKRPESK